MAPVNSLAFTTLVLSWLFVGLACLSIAATLVELKIKEARIWWSEGFLFASLVIGIVLVAQTTWGIVDEDGGKHQPEISDGHISKLAKVRGHFSTYTLTRLTIVVSDCK
jgi:hypothetical protein